MFSVLCQDLINVLWSTRESATLHILVVHAQIILLTYGSAHSNSELFNNLLLMWFPPGKWWKYCNIGYKIENISIRSCKS